MAGNRHAQFLHPYILHVLARISDHPDDDLPGASGVAFARRSTSRARIHLQRDAGTGKDFLRARDEFMEDCRAYISSLALWRYSAPQPRSPRPLHSLRTMFKATRGRGRADRMHRAVARSRTAARLSLATKLGSRGSIKQFLFASVNAWLFPYRWPFTNASGQLHPLRRR